MVPTTKCKVDWQSVSQTKVGAKEKLPGAVEFSRGVSYYFLGPEPWCSARLQLLECRGVQGPASVAVAKVKIPFKKQCPCVLWTTHCL